MMAHSWRLTIDYGGNEAIPAAVDGLDKPWRLGGIVQRFPQLAQTIGQRGLADIGL
jgi:hypothetical protein